MLKLSASDSTDSVHPRPLRGKQYFLELDGSLLREQRMALLKLRELAEPFAEPPAGSLMTTFRVRDFVEALDGLIELTDAIADQAHDIHGIDCLLKPY